MRYLNNGARAALIGLGLLTGGTALAHQAVGVPSVAPPARQTPPPASLPAGGGPSATSGTAAAARFDEVGYAATDGGQPGVAVSAIGLHPGSYAEITSLDSGRIILASVAPAAPPPGRLALLSRGAAQALGVAGGDVAVRVREVQPQAGDEAALHRGEPASPRLGAPASLLTGLRARLADVPKEPTAAPPGRAADGHHSQPMIAAGPTRPPATHLKPPEATPAPHPTAAEPAASAAAPHPAETKPAAPAKPAATGHYRVQVGAFANEANARKLAAQLGGHLVPSGKLWLVELGPFADAAAAKQARDGAAKHGYGGAEVRKD